MNGNIYSRQNDKIAIMYRKASKLVYERERFFKNLVITCSVMLCLASILNKYLLKIFPFVDFFSVNKEEISKWLSLVSGLLIIVQIAIGRYTNRMHIEGVGFEERFDNYVFAMRPNKMIMRPISDTIIENYASKIRKADEFFGNYYFTSASETFDRNVQFKHYKKIFEYEYKLLLNVKGFFQTVWIGFIVAIMVLALSFDSSFVETLISILIPSLSIISLIFNSWYVFGKQMNYLQNALNIIEDMAEKATFGSESPESLNNPTSLRAMQDCLFNQRMNSFSIPQFLVKIYSKRLKRYEVDKHRNFDKVVENTKSLVPITRDDSLMNIYKAENAVRAKYALRFEDEVGAVLDNSPKPKAKPKPKAEPKPKVDVKPKVEAKPKVEPNLKVEAKSKVEAKPKVEPKLKVDVKPKVEAKPKAEPKLKVEVKPKVKTVEIAPLESQKEVKSKTTKKK